MDVEEPSIRFELIECRTSPLWDFGWFDLSRFTVLPGAEARFDESEVLRAFLGDPLSQRSFCSPGPWGEPIGRHGPLVHGKLSPSLFESIGSGELSVRVRAALDDPDFSESPSPEQRAPVEAWLEESAARGCSVRALDLDADPTALVSWSWVWPVYHELVCMSSDRSTLDVAVVGFD